MKISLSLFPLTDSNHLKIFVRGMPIFIDSSIKDENKGLFMNNLGLSFVPIKPFLLIEFY